MRARAVESEVIKTLYGWVAVAYTDRGIRALTLPRESRDRALRALGRHIGPSSPGRRRCRELVRDLDRYFGGEPVVFDYSLDLTAGTPFQRRVWSVLRAIPRGKTWSYQNVARAVGKPDAARAVGQAVGANTIPVLIPCHRVVASGGGLGGYAWGLAWKRRLLRAEGLQV